MKIFPPSLFLLWSFGTTNLVSWLETENFAFNFALLHSAVAVVGVGVEGGEGVYRREMGMVLTTRRGSSGGGEDAKN